MAVIKTGAIFNKLVFGSVDSSNYGIYITGEAVFNAPQRAVEFVSVPGRNGAIEIDQGRWENIEVSYPAGCFGDKQSDFATAISNFRNAICSQIGYQRLTDTYNPNEYRMAIYSSGIEVEPASLNRAGEFTITFNCKPQRWLVSGETAVVVASGGELNNPTLLESSPLLAVKGYGNIDFGGYPISVVDEPLGEVQLLPQKTATKNFASSSDPLVIESTYSTESLSSGDAETLNSTVIQFSSDAGANQKWSQFAITSPASGTFKFNATVTGLNTRYVAVTLKPNVAISSAAGTAIIENTSTFTVAWTIASSGGSMSGTATYTFKYKKTVSGTNETLTLTVYANGQGATMSMSRGALIGNSTLSLLGDPTYIDMEIGEAYKIEGGVPVSLNSRIYIGGDLATLKPGANTITYDNTVTELKVTPRWWRL